MKQSGKKTALAAMGLCAALMLTGCGKSDAAKYEDAQKLVREGAYDEAITAFTEIDGYEDSSKYLMYIKAIQMAENGQRDLAVSTLTTLGDFADSKMLAIYYQAQEDEAKQEYESADALYRTIATFKDSAERIAAIPDLILDRDFANSKIQVEWDGDCSAMIALLEETYSADENKMKQQIYDYAQERLELKEYDTAYELFQALSWCKYNDSAVRMKDVVYAYAQDEMSQGEYQTALDTLRQLTDYPAAEEPIRECRYQLAMQAEADGRYARAYAEYIDLGEYKDCADKAARFENEYAAASALLAEGEYDNAKSAFEALKDYADAEKMAKESVYQKGEKLLADGRFYEAKTTFETLKDYADAQTMAKESVYRKGKKQLADGQYDLALSTFSALGTYKKAYDDASYAQSRIDMQRGDYQKALDGLVKLMGYGYQEAEEPILECRYQLAAQAENNGQYAQAYAEYIDLGEYKDCADKAARFENEYAAATALLAEGEYDNAKSAFEALKDYADAEKMAQESVYQKGGKQLADGQFDEAKATFESLKDYSDAETMVKESVYQKGKKQFADGQFDEAKATFESLKDYSDAETMVKESMYQKGKKQLADGLFAEAEATFDTLGEYSDTKEQILAIGEHYYATQQYGQAETAYIKVLETGIAAQRLYELGQYYESQDDLPRAIRVYGEAGTYEDAQDKVAMLQQEEDYRAAEALYQGKEWQEAKAIYERLTGYKDTESKIAMCDKEIEAAAVRDVAFQPGKIVQFGRYPQTTEGNDDTMIEWQVLDRDGRNVLLISRYGLDVQPYTCPHAQVTWEQCTLRIWLNDTFANRAFSQKEQQAILMTTVANGSDEGYWKTDGGNDTQDKIFLLSYRQAEQYFDVTIDNDENMKSRMQPTDYALAHGAGKRGWWLRSQGPEQDTAARVYSVGALDYDFTGFEECVRPALWVNIDSGVF